MSEDAHELVCSKCGQEPKLPNHAYGRNCKQQADRDYRRRQREERNRYRRQRRHPAELRAEYLRESRETV